MALWLLAADDEFIGTALLLAAIRAIASGGAPSRFVAAGWVGLAVFAIGTSFGVLSGFAINPVRDVGPRLVYLLLAAAHGEDDVWGTVLGGGYFWVPLVAPVAAALAAALVGRLVDGPKKDSAVADELCAVVVTQG